MAAHPDDEEVKRTTTRMVDIDESITSATIGGEDTHMTDVTSHRIIGVDASSPTPDMVTFTVRGQHAAGIDFGTGRVVSPQPYTRTFTLARGTPMREVYAEVKHDLRPADYDSDFRICPVGPSGDVDTTMPSWFDFDEERVSRDDAHFRYVVGGGQLDTSTDMKIQTFQRSMSVASTAALKTGATEFAAASRKEVEDEEQVEEKSIMPSLPPPPSAPRRRRRIRDSDMSEEDESSSLASATSTSPPATATGPGSFFAQHIPSTSSTPHIPPPRPHRQARPSTRTMDAYEKRAAERDDLGSGRARREVRASTAQLTQQSSANIPNPAYSGDVDEATKRALEKLDQPSPTSEEEEKAAADAAEARRQAEEERVEAARSRTPPLPREGEHAAAESEPMYLDTGVPIRVLNDLLSKGLGLGRGKYERGVSSHARAYQVYRDRLNAGDADRQKQSEANKKRMEQRKARRHKASAATAATTTSTLSQLGGTTSVGSTSLDQPIQAIVVAEKSSTAISSGLTGTAVPQPGGLQAAVPIQPSSAVASRVGGRDMSQMTQRLDMNALPYTRPNTVAGLTDAVYQWQFDLATAKPSMMKLDSLDYSGFGNVDLEERKSYRNVYPPMLADVRRWVEKHITWPHAHVTHRLDSDVKKKFFLDSPSTLAVPFYYQHRDEPGVPGWIAAEPNLLLFLTGYSRSRQ
jgi:hypothetical protein